MNPPNDLSIIVTPSMYVADFEFDDTPLMGVEPLPNIRDGIFVKRLVKTLRYVTDMGRCQYVVQRPERVRRRERLNIEYVDRRSSESLVLQRGDQRSLLDDRPARRID